MSSCLRITDEDAADFLQSQFSNDLRPFCDGQITYGLWLDKKGRVFADSYILCENGETFYALSEHCDGDLIKEKLERHIIADDVVVEKVDLDLCLALVGEDVSDYLEKRGFLVPDKESYLKSEDLIIFQGRRSQLPSFELIPLSGRTAEILGNIRNDINVRSVGEDWIHSQRISAHSVLVPAEIGPSDLPAEGGLVPKAVSLEKGCFLGQEVIARMYNLGRPLRALHKVSGDGDIPHIPQKVFNADGKPVGELRSAYMYDSGWFGIALLKIRYTEKERSGFCLEDGSAVIYGTPFNQK